MGHAARTFLPSGQVFASRRVTFFLRAQKKSNQKKTAPCGALASLATLLGLSSSAPSSEGRGTLDKNLEGVSNALCIQPRVFDTRLLNSHMPTLPYLMSTYKLTKSNAKLTFQRPYIAAC